MNSRNKCCLFVKKDYSKQSLSVFSESTSLHHQAFERLNHTKLQFLARFVDEMTYLAEPCKKKKP